MITIRADFNSLVRDGLVRASLRRASGDVGVGDRVLAVDPGDGSFFATVESVDLPRGRVYLRMHWEPVEPLFTFTHVAGPFIVDSPNQSSSPSSWEQYQHRHLVDVA
jgi:hypothetical protein